MVREKIAVRNPLGLHLRPASNLCTRAAGFEAKITICFRNREFNAKSLLGVLSACVQHGDEIEVVCSGKDEQEALAALTELLESEE